MIGLARWVLGDARWRAFDEIKLVVRKGATKADGSTEKKGQPTPLLALSLRTPSLVLLPLAAMPSALYTFRRSALLTDVLALAFAHNALALLKLDSFRTGAILLGGLFVYDVWWVFGTEVMVKVATSLDVPIKLLYPKSLVFSTARGFTMLGLGDIVVPGIFVALALRYDHHRAGGRGRYSKPYFWAQMGAYGVGLGVTMAVMVRARVVSR